jgi:O-antigen/teichoic acid export membrane protein
MSLAKKLVKNTALLYCGEVISKIFQILLVIILARHYGPNVFGEYSFAIVFTFVFSMFVDLGLNTLVLREVSVNKGLTSKYLKNIFFVKVLFSVLTFALIILIINLMEYSSEVKFLVYCFGLYNIFLQLVEYIKVFFKAYEFMHIDCMIRVFEKITTVVTSLVLIFLGFSIIYVALVFVTSAVLTTIFALILIKKKISEFSAKLDGDFTKSFMIRVIPFAVSSILYMIYLKSDIIIINSMIGSELTGIYTSAMQLIETLLFITTFIGLAVFPVISKSFVENKTRFWRIYEKISKFLFIIGLPIVIGTFILSDRFISAIYGNQYKGAGIILKILIFFIFFHFLTAFNGYTLYSMQLEKKLVLISIFVVLINIILNYVLIARYSILGAAIAKILAELVFFGWTFIAVKPNIDKVALMITAKMLIVGFFIFALTKFIKSLNLFLIISIVALVYTGLILLLKIISDEDINIIKEFTKH